MKTIFIFILLVFSYGNLFSQVGISTIDPKATLDVVGTPATATAVGSWRLCLL